MFNKNENSEEIEKKLITYKQCCDERKKHLLHIRIIEEAMYLVKKFASSISQPSGVPIEDLMQVGSIGLIKAIEFFDININVWMILFFILDILKKSV